MGSLSIDELLERPSGEAARRHALALLEDALAARGRIDERSDLEAIHDFRVALRRLRAHLSTHREELGGRVNRLRRELGDVAGLTGDARDAEVQLEWLAARRATLSPPRRSALDWISARLSERK